ncbi:MAG: hypothetical protein FVQ86_06310 [candidate division NC10 bacterium]|nr:hypothetical protein [candidate division NC10 bacterium]
MKPLVGIEGYAWARLTPKYFMTVPAEAIKQVFKRTGDIDPFEIKEAFAAVPLLTKAT